MENPRRSFPFLTPNYTLSYPVSFPAKPLAGLPTIILPSWLMPSLSTTTGHYKNKVFAESSPWPFLMSTVVVSLQQWPQWRSPFWNPHLLWILTILRSPSCPWNWMTLRLHWHAAAVSNKTSHWIFTVLCVILARENDSYFISEKTKAQKVILLEAYGRTGSWTQVFCLPVRCSLRDHLVWETISCSCCKVFTITSPRHPAFLLWAFCSRIGYIL